jgi:hypothetical protein
MLSLITKIKLEQIAYKDMFATPSFFRNHGCRCVSSSFFGLHVSVEYGQQIDIVVVDSRRMTIAYSVINPSRQSIISWSRVRWPEKSGGYITPRLWGVDYITPKPMKWSISPPRLWGVDYITPQHVIWSISLINYSKLVKLPLKQFWKITINHRKIIKWIIQLCWT